MPSDEYNDLFKTIVDTSYDGVIILETFRISYTNKMFQSMVNFSDNELLEKNITELIYKDDILMLKDNIIMADKTLNYTSHIKIRMINKFGETIFSELTIKKILSGIGHKIIITATDISYLASQEDNESKYSVNLKFLNNTAIDFISMVNLKDIYQYVLDKVLIMINKPIVLISSYNKPANILTVELVHGLDPVVKSILNFLKIDYKNLSVTLPDDIKEKLISGKITEVRGGLFELSFGKIQGFAALMIEKAMQMDKLYTIGLSYSHNLYGSISIITRKSTDKIDTNLIETFLYQASATIQRKHLEMELDQEKEFQARLIESSLFPLVITDHRGKISFASKNIHSITGYSNKEMIGKMIYSFTNEIYYNEISSHINSLKSSSPISNIYLIKHKDSKEIFCEVNVDIVFDSHNNKKFIMAINDITERINYETELENSKNKAEQSDQLKTAFLSNLSHEIRTPMNGIIGFSDLLKSSLLTDEEKRQYVDIINNSGKQLLSLINDIIDISRIESGEISIDYEVFNINTMFTEIVDYFNEYKKINKHINKEVEITFYCEKKLDHTIETDKNKLHQILTNLISNALKFTPSGHVELGYIIKDKNTLYIYVKDSGIGIDPSMHTAIFERFRQVDDSSKKKYAGSGLGLAITKSLIELLGGSINLDSAPGKGTTMYFYLPYKSNGKQLITTEVLPQVNEHKNFKILVAEDDDTNYKFFSIFLYKIYGIKTYRAITGAEAVEILKSQSDFDLVFMDMNMPEMDGYEACQEIRKFNKEVIIIANTAYTTTSERKKCFESGCNDFIAKPINTQKLTQLLNKYFGK